MCFWSGIRLALPGVSNPWPTDHMQRRMALNVVQQKIGNLLTTLWDFFVLICHNVFNVRPKTTLPLPVFPRDAKRLDPLLGHAWSFDMVPEQDLKMRKDEVETCLVLEAIAACWSQTKSPSLWRTFGYQRSPKVALSPSHLHHSGGRCYSSHQRSTVTQDRAIELLRDSRVCSWVLTWLSPCNLSVHTHAHTHTRMQLNFPTKLEPLWE